MKHMRLSRLSVWVVICAFLLSYGLLPGQEAPERPEEPENLPEETETIALESVPLQQVIDQLFGTPETAGLLDSGKSVVLHAEDISLTTEQATSFFSPAAPSETSFAALVAAFHETKQGNVRIGGTVDGSPFNMMIAGRQLKLEGVSLTQAELDSLLGSLQETTGLHNVRINATVDGQPVSVHLQNRAGRLRIEDRIVEGDEGEFEDLDAEDLREANQLRGNENREQGRARGQESHELRDRAERGRSERLEAGDRGRGPERRERVERVERIEKVDRPEKPERPERPERLERAERIERIERFERPEIPGRGRP